MSEALPVIGLVVLVLAVVAVIAGLAVGVLVLPFALFATWIDRFAMWIDRENYRRHHGLCVACGYNLTGNVSGVCPECGAAVEDPRVTDQGE